MDRKIIVYSTSWCQPCKLAKKLLQERGLEYQEIDIEERGWSRDDLYETTGGRTVPQIIINDKSIGGFNELLQLNNSGKLKELLKDD